MPLHKAAKATINVVNEPGSMPEVFVSGFIYDGFGAYLNQYLLDLSRSYGEVMLYVDSSGGFIQDALSTYDFIQRHGIRVHCEGYGIVASAATIYFCAAGPSRCALAPHTDWMIHGVYNINTGSRDDENALRDTERITAIYAQHTGMSKAKIAKLLAEGDQGKKWSAEEAKEQGFISTILRALNKAAAFVPNTEENIEVIQPETPSPMSDPKKKVTVMAALKDGFKNLKAAAMGEAVEVEIDATEELAKATQDRIAAEAKAKEATDELVAFKEREQRMKDAIEGKDKAIEEVTKAKDDVTAELATTKTALNTANESITAKDAELTKLRELPVVKALNLTGDAGEDKTKIAPDAPVVHEAYKEQARMIALQERIKTGK